MAKYLFGIGEAIIIIAIVGIIVVAIISQEFDLKLIAIEIISSLLSASIFLGLAEILERQEKLEKKIDKLIEYGTPNNSANK